MLRICSWSSLLLTSSLLQVEETFMRASPRRVSSPSEASMKSSLESLCPPGSCRSLACPSSSLRPLRACRGLAWVQRLWDFLKEKIVLIILNGQWVTTTFANLIGHNHNIILTWTCSSAGPPTMRSQWTTAPGRNKRAPDSVFAQEPDPKHGKVQQWILRSIWFVFDLFLSIVYSSCRYR